MSDTAAAAENAAIEDATENVEMAQTAESEAVENEEETEETGPAWQPIVEKRRLPIAVATVILMAGTTVRLGLHLSTLPVLAFASTAVVLSVIDFAILRLPNAFVIPTGIAVVVACVVQALAEHHTRVLTTEAEGAAAVAGFYALLYVLSRGGLGLGDVKLGVVTGALLASRDWQHVLDGTFLAYLVTLVVAIAMMTRHRKRFPYGPGIIIGTLAVLLLG